MSAAEDISAELNAMRAEIASMKNLIKGMQAAGEISGLDYTTMFGQDDDYMPNVPIGGEGWKNFEVECKGDGKYTIKSGSVCIGRKNVRVEGKDVEDGEYRLKIELGSDNNVEIEEGSGYTDPEDGTSYIPLYKLNDDKIEEDYRFNFCVVARE